MLDRVQRVLDRPVFSAGDRTFTWGDVVDAAVARGDWDAISRRARQRLAYARRAEHAGGAVDAGEVERAANAFRRARNLLAADEMEAWLDAWGLTIESWLEWTRCSLLREQMPVRPEAEAQTASPSRECEWTEAVCSGALHRLALDLAEGVAAFERFSGRAPQRGEIAQTQVAVERLRAEAVSPAAVEREVAAHWLEWTLVDCRCVTATDEDVARELALCVREDALALAQVAADAALHVEERSWYLADPQPLGERLLGAQPGELLGPAPVEGGLLLCLVVARAVPNAADPRTAERATRHIARRALEREVAGRVRWHEPMVTT